MRQKLEIIVMASVDVDDWIPHQSFMELALKEQVAAVVTKLTDEPEPMIEIEYGEPV